MQISPLQTLYPFRIMEPEFRENIHYHRIIQIRLILSTKINFDLPYNSNVTLKIMDISGKEIGTIVKGFYNAGSYNVTFSANELGTSSCKRDLLL